MPLIVPVLPTSAAPSAAEPPAAASTSAPSESAPRFSDALSRAGQAQSEQSGAPNPSGAQSQAGGNAPTEASAQKPASAGAADTTSQTKADAAQQGSQQPTANSTAGNTDAAALALQLGGTLQAAIAPNQSGKNLPHGNRKADAAEPPAATPGQMLGMMPLLPQPAQPAAPIATPTDAASPAGAAQAAASLSGRQDAALQSALPKSATDNTMQDARPGGAQAAAGQLPAWLQGAAARGADAEQQSSRFAVLQAQSASVTEVAPLNSLQTSRTDPANPTNAPSQLAQSLALALPPTTQAPQPVMTAAVHVPVGSPDWGQAMNQQVLFAAQGQQQFATLHLNPPQLGSLEVHLQLHDGQIQAQFVSPHAMVRQAVEAALPQLRDLFTGAGLSLMQTSVSTQGGQGERQQQARAQRGAAGLSAIGESGAEPSGSAAVLPQRWQQGMVNTYV